MTSNITVTVGSGGDFSTINDAINYLVNNFLPPCYRTNSGTPKAKIRILSGTTITEKIIIRCIDLSWITINSEDSTVTVNLGSEGGAFIIGYDCAKLPVIDTTFSINSTSGSTKGILITQRSEAYISFGKGIIISNIGYAPLYISDGSILRAEGRTVLQGISKSNVAYAIYVDSSMVFLPNATINKAGTLIYGRYSFIRLLGANFGTDYNTKFSLTSCDCIPNT
jgi:hypothetical protein